MGSAAGAGIGGGAGDGEAARAERLAYEKAKPVFETYCAPCHTGGGDRASKSALSHFSMDGYPFGGHHARQVTHTIRRVLGASGSKATMPRDQPGAVRGEDLLLILAWAEAHDRAHAGSESSPDQPHSSGAPHH
jgi:hypothetical protein